MIRYFVLSLLVSLSSLGSLLAVQDAPDEEILTILRESRLKLVLIRHGEAIHNIPHLMNSSSSPGIYLTDRGEMQVQELAKQLEKIPIDLVYTSPLFCTMQTASFIGRSLGLPHRALRIDDRLKEQHFGEYEDRTYEEYMGLFAHPHHQFILGAPGGETGEQLRHRVRDFLLFLAHKTPNRTVALVTHAYVCCQVSHLLTGQWNSIPRQAEYQWFDFDQ